MADEVQTGNQDVQTKDNLATELQNENPAIDPANEKVEIKKEDYQNLISQRDRANQQLKDMEEQGNGGGLDDAVIELLVEREANKFLSDPKNKEKYPNLKTEDLMGASSISELEAIAERTQTRINEEVENRLNDVQVADNRPRLTEQDRKATLDKLRGTGDPTAFGTMLDVRGLK